MIRVQHIAFGDDEVTVQFSTDQDVRTLAGLPTVMSSQLTVLRGHPSYPEIGELYDAAVDAVRDLLSDFVKAPVWAPPALPQDDDDEPEGMGQ